MALLTKFIERMMGMIYTEMTKKAMKVAYEAHKWQTDKTGLPYIFHPYHLAEQMTTEETTAAALLHDTVEDTGMTLKKLRELGFPESVVTAVDCLTHREGEDYFDYVRRAGSDPVARPVKIADLKHNSDLSRLSEVTEKDLKRAEKYAKALEILKNI